MEGKAQHCFMAMLHWIFPHTNKKGAIYATEGETRQALELARHLCKPFIIATADQIAPAALKYPGYERIFAKMMDSLLVIDEVQAYDPKAAAIITHLIHQNHLLGGRTLLMTATLPPHIRNEINQRLNLGENRIISLMAQNEFHYIAESSRHRVEFLCHDGDYEEIIKKAVYSARQGKKVLIVMNTVKAAVQVYENIMAGSGKKEHEFSITLLHSRFTSLQRQTLEKDIVDNIMPNKVTRNADACIVVSTQVVEASLDIDADLLITEAAPPDSLIQRMGRVFRRYSRKKGNHSPEYPNVIIAVDLSQTGKSGEVKLYSGKGIVYDRDLTVLSLVWLMMKMGTQKVVSNISDFLGELQQEKEPWQHFFRKKKSEDQKSQNKKLALYLRGTVQGKNTVLTESDKMDWVELCYGTLDQVGIYQTGELYLGNYLQSYYDTLRTLDHGYCYDKKT